MRSLRMKLLLYILLVGLVPMLFFSFYYYDVKQNEAIGKLESESENILEQFENRMVVKLTRIQNTVDVLLNDADFYRIVTEIDGTKEKSEITQSKLDAIFGYFYRSESRLLSMIMLPVNGGAYVAGDTSNIEDPLSFIMQYDKRNMEASRLNWMGLKDKTKFNDKEIILAGVMLRDTAYQKNEQYLGTVYLIFDDLLLGDTASKTVDEAAETYYEQEIIDTNENISIYDESFNLIFSSGDERLRNSLFATPVDELLNDIRGSTKSVMVQTNGGEYIVVSRTSSLTGWRFVRTFPYERYQSDTRHITLVMIVCFLLMFLLWYVVNHFVVKKMTLPIYDLIKAMKLVENQDFDVKLKVESKGDFGMINRGFNNMVSQIKSLFERTVKIEKQRREQEMLMLRYQINPHFLFNTIGAIRLAALQDKQDKIAKMLLALSRFLRNAVKSTAEMIDVKTEIANICDYITLFQIRYKERLVFNVDVDEECYDYKIPALLCQPIIENSLMHGLNEKLYYGEPAVITLKIEDIGSDIQIGVHDNGKGMNKETLMELFADSKSTSKDAEPDNVHIGLKNTQKRIQLLFGNEYGIEVETEEGSYTLVKIRLPKIE